MASCRTEQLLLKTLYRVARIGGAGIETISHPTSVPGF